MAVPIFEFTPYKSSYSVHIPNLEKLSVEQIQEIELFVSQRKGVFDFARYSFSIQKRVDFFEFEKLLKNTSLNVRTINKPLIQKVQARVSFGKYKGVYFSEIPDAYLIWLKSNYSGRDRDEILAELKKRRL
ncbi:MAG: DUF3820 family protein [Campylobacterota bacterium]|nr:DUF3820 family protein [Campylobacterota bacterium]